MFYRFSLLTILNIFMSGLLSWVTTFVVYFVFFSSYIFTVGQDLGVDDHKTFPSEKKCRQNRLWRERRKRDVNALSRSIAVFFPFLPIKNKTVLRNILYYILGDFGLSNDLLGNGFDGVFGPIQSATVYGNANAFLCKTRSK